jgi:hypothetical protein
MERSRGTLMTVQVALLTKLLVGIHDLKSITLNDRSAPLALGAPSLAVEVSHECQVFGKQQNKTGQEFISGRNVLSQSGS